MIPTSEPYGVYVHVPFCRMLCTYCDFVKYRGLEAWYTRYMGALLREAETWRGKLADRRGISLFFGGGTPSVLGPSALGTLRERMVEIFGLDQHAEYCLEANPEDVDSAFAGGVADAGFTRVSVGLQTFDDALLRRLGRLHSGEQAEMAVRRLLAAGLPSVSGDLIYGLPGQSAASWQATLDRALALRVPHLSCYGLTVEPATPLGRQVARRRITVPDDDAAADMYETTCGRLAAAGYRHYEVSNWSLPGHESRHNGLYWQGNDYIGLGAGAVGYLERKRWWNRRQVAAYCTAMEGGDPASTEVEVLTPAQRAEELLLLALRTEAGLDLAHFRREVGVELTVIADAALADAQEAGLVVRDAGRLRVPQSRWGVLHSVVARLLAGMDLRTAA
jgi:oxygen-independent coproporphyrinogen III oxidase